MFTWIAPIGLLILIITFFMYMWRLKDITDAFKYWIGSAVLNSREEKLNKLGLILVAVGLVTNFIVKFFGL